MSGNFPGFCSDRTLTAIGRENVLSVVFLALSLQNIESFRSVCAHVVDTFRCQREICKTGELVRREEGSEIYESDDLIMTWSVFECEYGCRRGMILTYGVGSVSWRSWHEGASAEGCILRVQGKSATAKED